MSKKIIFVAWNMTTRSRVLADYLHAQLIRYQVPTNRVLRLFNYPFLMLITFGKLLQQKPDIVIAQLPPIQVSIPVYMYCKLYRKKIIFDTHSGIFFQKGLHQKLYYHKYCHMIKRINLNLVHNDLLLSRKCLKDTHTIVLEDKIPFNPSTCSHYQPFNVVVICSYSKDEPINAIIKATALIPDVNFYLTGKGDKLKNMPMTNNVKLTGYLSNTEYEKLLKTTDLIIVLTTRPETVLCGAYEAVSLEKPLITSDTQTLRKYFDKGTVYTLNKAEAIAQAILEAKNKLDKLHAEMALLRKEKDLDWQKQFEPVKKLLES